MARTKQVAKKGGAAEKKEGASASASATPYSALPKCTYPLPIPKGNSPKRHTSNIPAKDPKDVIIYKLKEENLSLKQQLAKKSGMSLHDWRLEFDPSYFPSIAGNASIEDFLEVSKDPEEEEKKINQE